MKPAFAAALGAATLVALPAHPALADFDLDEAQEEIAEMIGENYVGADTLPMSATAVVSMLEKLGYTDIEDFDVDPGEYEIEATNAEGIEVEIEIDPLTGDILEIEED